MKIIVNADDLGASVTVNDAIFALVDRRAISSATLLPNGAALEDAMSRTTARPFASFGVHLNLTEFVSLSRGAALEACGIIDAQGNFTGNVRHVRPSFAAIRAVTEEWSAQITRLMDGGIMPSHIDGHHHVHTIPWLFGALKTVQCRFGIHRVRAPLNCCFPGGYAHSMPRDIAKRVWNIAVRGAGKTRTTKYFTDLTWFVMHSRRGTAPRDGTLELMCHPGSDYMPGEAALLASDWWNELRVPVELISYSEL